MGYVILMVLLLSTPIVTVTCVMTLVKKVDRYHREIVYASKDILDSVVDLKESNDIIDIPNVDIKQ